MGGGAIFRLAGKVPPTLKEMQKKAQYQPANGGACLHGANPQKIVNRLSDQLFQLVQQTLHISQSSGHVVGIVPILVGINVQVSCNGKQLSDFIVAGLGHQPRDRVIQRDVASMRPPAPSATDLTIWAVRPSLSRTPSGHRQPQARFPLERANGGCPLCRSALPSVSSQRMSYWSCSF